MRAKAPPFARRLRAALEAARAAGFARVRVSTGDGSTFVFSQDDVDALPPKSEVEVNDFDEIMKKREAAHEEKP
jgi:hypothetical protein